MGLKKEKEKQSNRVAETRGKRLKDFILDDDDDLDGDGSANPTPDASPLNSATQQVPKKPIVRALSQRFDPNALNSPASVGTPQQQQNEGASRSNSPIRPREELSADGAENVESTPQAQEKNATD